MNKNSKLKATYFYISFMGEFLTCLFIKCCNFVSKKNMEAYAGEY